MENKIDASTGMKQDYSTVKEGDVVILPAFGATIQEMQYLDEKKVKIVDTTCPWVSKVWNAVDSHIKAGQTSVIHGKYSHEETIATASFCDNYIIVKVCFLVDESTDIYAIFIDHCSQDLVEAQYVADYIVNGGNKEEFMVIAPSHTPYLYKREKNHYHLPFSLIKKNSQAKFKKATSKDFDPDVHLKKVGLANQTTMYKRETKEVGRIFEVAMLKKFGPSNLSEHYSEFDTICDATQERQDAVTDLVQSSGIFAGQSPVDFVLVVGGFDSSNTAHLKEIPEKYNVPSYHIDRDSRIMPDNTIEHRDIDGKIVIQKNFLKKGPVTIGVTSGASTPDKCVEDALEKIFMMHKLL